MQLGHLRAEIATESSADLPWIRQEHANRAADVNNDLLVLLGVCSL